MKKIVLSVLALVALGTLRESWPAQQTIERGNEGLSVQVDQSTYLPLQPIFARFKYQRLGKEPKVRPEEVFVRVGFNGRIREFRGASLITSTGGGERLPPDETFAQVFPEQAKKRRDADAALVTDDVELIIDRVAEFFPKYGKYSIQFVFRGKTSNSIQMELKPARALDLAALETLKRYEEPLTFGWVGSEGIGALASFVDQFGKSVYGEYARFHLAIFYMIKNDLENARREFERLKDSDHKSISESAKQNVAEIDRLRSFPEAAKLELRGTTPKTTYLIGEPVTIRFSLINTGGATLKIPSGGVEVGSLKIAIAGPGNELFKEYRQSSWGRLRGRSVDLKPGETYSYPEVTLLWNGKADLSHLSDDWIRRISVEIVTTEYAFQEPGVYVVKGTSFYGETMQKIDAEPILLQISEPKGDDLKVWNEISGNKDIAHLIQYGDFDATDWPQRHELVTKIERVCASYPESLYCTYLNARLIKLKYR
jgi:hypothetical protein